MDKELNRNQQITLGVILFAVASAIRLSCYTGLIASDDLGYADYARQISEANYKLEPHHYAIRYGVIVPVALIYRCFGIHEWTTVLLPLLYSSLATSLTGLFAARVYGRPSAGWVAGLLMATFPVEVRYASILVPEPMIQALVLAGAHTFLSAERRSSGVLAWSAGLILGLAYMTKEPGIFVAAAFFLYAFLRRRWRLAFLFSTGVALVIAAELAWYWGQSGDLLFRSHAMTAHNQSDMAVDANVHLSYRLWKVYPRMMIVPNIDFGLHSVAAIGLASLALLPGRRFKEVPLLMLWAVLPWLYLNFGSSRFDKFWALPAAPRYITLAYPPLFVMASVTLVDWARRGRWQGLGVGALLLGISSAGIACAVMTRGTGYSASHVHRLKTIAAAARSRGEHFSEFSGPHGAVWRKVLRIIAPDTIGGPDGRSLHLAPDSEALPALEE